jgi:hypothetical protein
MTNTANFQRARVGAAVTLAITAAMCGPAASAAADPTPGSVCDPDPTTNPSYDPTFCASWTQAPTPTTGRVEQGLDRLLDNPFVVVGGILIAVLVIGWILATVFGTNDPKAQVRGRQIAEAHQRPALVTPAADPAAYDPLGLGLAAPTAPAGPEPAPIPEPRVSDEDAQRYGRFGRPVDWEPGTAFAALTSRDGSWQRAEEAWSEACRAANLGEVQQRQSRIPGVDRTRDVYVPAADLVRIDPLDGGDAAVVVKARAISIGAGELNLAVPFFLRTARLRHAGRFAREHTRDEFVLVVTNRAVEDEKPAPAAAATTDDDWS